MMYCGKCGTKLKDTANFCYKCGSEVLKNTGEDRTQVKKCPNCGHSLDAFTTVCQFCGSEVQEKRSSATVRDFSSDLQNIERARGGSGNRRWDRPSSNPTLSRTDDRKIDLIRSYAIPNNKVDILDFMILAKSNIDYAALNKVDPGHAKDRKLAEAWITKVQQVYDKALHTFRQDVEFQRIQALYNETMARVRREKLLYRVKSFLQHGSWIPLVLLVLYVWYLFTK